MLNTMKTLTILANVTLLFLISFVLVGCGSTTGLERSEAIQTSMERVDDNIGEIQSQVNAVNSSLSELTRRGQGDIKGSFERFSEEASKLREMEREFVKNADRMESNAEAYFEGWSRADEQYENPEIKRRSEERRQELSQKYDRVNQNSNSVKQDLRSYVSDINEIETFLSNDLTSQGINSIASVSNEAVNKGDRLSSELGSLQTAIASTRDEMRHGGLTMN